ncbi:MAG: hypothetical protein WC843_04895 [Candidatus Gracilibacteria bacterium]|jgi:hypothetical protein
MLHFKKFRHCGATNLPAFLNNRLVFQVAGPAETAGQKPDTEQVKKDMVEATERIQKDILAPEKEFNADEIIKGQNAEITSIAEIALGKLPKEGTDADKQARKEIEEARNKALAEIVANTENYRRLEKFVDKKTELKATLAKNDGAFKELMVKGLDIHAVEIMKKVGAELTLNAAELDGLLVPGFEKDNQELYQSVHDQVDQFDQAAEAFTNNLDSKVKKGDDALKDVNGFLDEPNHAAAINALVKGREKMVGDSAAGKNEKTFNDLVGERSAQLAQNVSTLLDQNGVLVEMIEQFNRAGDLKDPKLLSIKAAAEKQKTDIDATLKKTFQAMASSPDDQKVLALSLENGQGYLTATNKLIELQNQPIKNSVHTAEIIKAQGWQAGARAKAEELKPQTEAHVKIWALGRYLNGQGAPVETSKEPIAANTAEEPAKVKEPS